MLFGRIGQEHDFVSEFEKIPDLADLSIYEDLNNNDAFNFISIYINTMQVNINEYVASYPIKEFDRFANKGTIVTYNSSLNI